MAGQFGIPPEGDKIGLMVAERLRQAKQDDGAKVTVDWRGEQKHLYVVSMPVDMLYFNPDTHRIRAQRTLDPVRNRVLEENPWSDEAQDYLAYLLRCKPSNLDQVDPDFEALMDELDDSGQRDPGIISPKGILVDGNTRCAALRELGIKDIRVGVLPSDTSRRDINEVELSLQLRRDKRRDYSYINRLIAIEDELAGGRQPEDVARDFNIKLATLKGDRWVYGLIRDAIDRSRTETGAQLRLIDFEEHQEKLRELRRDYAKLAETDPDGAERLKESRLAAVVLNYSKTTLRLMELDFYDRYLERQLPQELKPAVVDSVAIQIPGLPGVAVPGAAADVKTSQTLTDTLLKAKALSQVGDGLPPAELATADRILKNARESFDTATRMAGKDAQYQKRQVAVPERLTDAADYVSQCVAEFAEAKSKRALDEEAFDDALLELKASLVRLAKLAARAFDTPSDGVEWLLASTREKE
ncbi:ParB N-terminal domain-containing protein [Nocardia sp. NPDC020380]|uniref:ParB N-terminal domain-containing protein n=1 Tax=Nocardia sp. NPDC020380 TaxID=3364309 RepID=UPI003795C0E4